MSTQNNVKPDIILKNFWKNNEHFADIFNAYLFQGEQIIKSEDLTEADTDISSLIKFNGHAETLGKVFDVVKKSANGVDYVILGLENQSKIHYAMPLRHMIGDAFSYLKEYKELEAKNKKYKNYKTKHEFLSKFQKTDRLHPIVTICIYYGEDEWDGPRSLIDMLDIPEEFESLISDYKFNLIELRKSELLKFQNEDVKTIFDISRFIYNREYDKINNIYKEKTISPELGMVIGLITETQKLIDDSLRLEQEGVEFNMCKALEELEERGRIEGAIRISKRVNASKEDTIKNIMEEFSLDKETASKYVEEYY